MNDAPVKEESLESLVGEVVDEFLKRQEQGEHPQVDEYVARYPQAAEVLRKVLTSLRLLELSGASPGEAGETLAGALGDFRLVREIGRGGMGVVYEAEQISLGRRVAVKVLPFAGALDARQLQRFKNEAQAAAHLHHTNIVPVYYVGSERGVHFYAMQLIDGCTFAALIRELRRAARHELEADAVPSAPEMDIAIALLSGQQPAGQPAPADAPPTVGYAPPAPEQQHLSPGGTKEGSQRETATAAVAALSTERSTNNRAFFRMAAELGIQAAQALDHAHQAGVVHRDIKPANLLLDARGNLWVTDFGLAQVQREANLTMTGDLVGTLRYMSPEQALANRVVIDHRTDVYSLGVTLYELLTLQPPFLGKDRQELLRQIAFDEPRSPRRLNKAIPAELETIILKAIAKNPQERYGTARELADDLRYYLEDKPIKARRPTLGQRLGRWSRRHQALVRAALVMLLLAVVGLGVSAALIARAYRSEAEKAAELRAVGNFLVKDLLGSIRPENARGKKVTVEEVLANAEKKIDGAFAGQPRPEAAIRRTIGSIYQALGLNPAAESHLKRARDLCAQVLGEDHPDTLYTMNILAIVLRDQGKYDEARQMHEEELRRKRKVLGEDHPDTLGSMADLGCVLKFQGKTDEAGRLVAEALGRMRHALGENNHDTLNTMHNLAAILLDQGKHEEARRLLEVALGGKRKVLGEDHPDTLRTMQVLAEAFRNQGKREEARRLYEEALRGMQKVLGENHPGTLITMNNLALVFQDQAKYEEAQRLLEEALRRRRKVLGEKHHATLESTRFLADVLSAQGKDEEAGRLLEEVLPLYRNVLGEEHPDTPTAMYRLFIVLVHQDKLEEARRLIEETLRLSRKVQGGNHPHTLIFMEALAIVLSYEGKDEEARRLHEEVLRLRRKVLGKDHPDTVNAMSNFAQFLVNCDVRHRDAARAMDLATKATTLSPSNGDCWEALGVVCYRTGDWKGALAALNKSVELHNGGEGSNRFFLAMTQWRLGEKDQARKLLNQDIAWMDKIRPKHPELRRFRAEATALLGVQDSPPPTKK